MQEAIMRIGGIVLKGNGNNFYNSLIQTRKINNTVQKYILKINFDTVKNTISFDAEEEMDKNSWNKYGFIGKGIGNNPSPCITMLPGSITCLLSSALNDIFKIEPGKEIQDKITIILNNFFIRYYKSSKAKAEKESPQYIFDTKKIGLPEGKITQDGIYESKFMKTVKKEFGDTVEKYLNQKYNITLVFNNKNIALSRIGLVTILIDGKTLRDDNNYTKAVEEFKACIEEKSKTRHGVCSSCGIDTTAYSTKNTLIKLFTTNLSIFSRANDYGSNMILCKECLKKYIAGEVYLRNNLDGHFCGFKTYVVPDIVFGKPFDLKRLDMAASNIEYTLNGVSGYKNVEEFYKYIHRRIDNSQFYLTNLMFYRAANSATKVKGIVRDITPSRFREIKEAQNYVADILYELGINRKDEEKMRISVGIGTAYYVTPLKAVKSGAKEYLDEAKLLAVYDAIFTRKPIKKKVIVENAVKAMHVIHYNTPDFNISEAKKKKDSKTEDSSASKISDESITLARIKHLIFSTISYILFLERINCLKEDTPMDFSKLAISKNPYYTKALEFFKIANYTEEKVALFLVGAMMAEAGRILRDKMKAKQIAKGENSKNNKDDKDSKDNKNDENKCKEVLLSKMNYDGMDIKRVITFENEIENKIRELDSTYNGSIAALSDLHMLIAKDIEHWNLNNVENVFYINVGYYFKKCLFFDPKNKDKDADQQDDDDLDNIDDEESGSDDNEEDEEDE